MVRIFIRLALCCSLGAVVAHGMGQTGEFVAGIEQNTYTNLRDIRLSSPFILKDEQSYYLYGKPVHARSFEVLKSQDLINWRRLKTCYQGDSSTAWGKGSFSGPEVVRRNNEYYMVFAAGGKGVRSNICVAKSKSPVGPFTEIAGPLLPSYDSLIEPHLFHDPASRRTFLYASDSTTTPLVIRAFELSDSLTSVKQTVVECIRADTEWEGKYVEAPFVFLRDGTYYMMYSGRKWYEETASIGYATAAGPLGPWMKHKGNPIMTPKENLIPSHNSVIASPDGNQLWCVYQGIVLPADRTPHVALDQIRVEKSAAGPAVLSLRDAPSTTPRELPSGTPPFFAGVSDNFDADHLISRVWFIRNETPGNWRIANGALTITPTGGDVWTTRRDYENVFLQIAPGDTYAFFAKLKITPRANHEQAFLMIWQDEDNYLKLAAVYSSGTSFEFAHETAGKYKTDVVKASYAGDVYLGIEAAGRKYRAFASSDGITWRRIGPEITVGFNQARVGFGAWSPGSRFRTPVPFDSFKFVKAGFFDEKSKQ